MANPNAREQELLELTNRMRANPAAELPLLLNSADPQVVNALNYFKVDRNLLATQWSTLIAASPLAWSSQLNDVAVAHNQKMIQYDQQSHDVGLYDSAGNLITAYEPSFTGRFAAVNYNFSYVGENIFAYADSTFATQASWAIDWGGTAATGGIQNPAGHRDNIMLSLFREAGFSIIDEANPNTQVGPLVVTGEFGNRNALNGKAWLLGVAFQDTNKNGWYEAGEGLSDVQVEITGINGTTFSNKLTVGTAGGYQDLLNPGQYKIDFSRNGIVINSKTTLISATAPANVKIDLNNIAATRNDFNGDGKSDILWRNDFGSVAVWQMNGATVTAGSLTSIPNIDASWKAAGTGDFNGDRKSDILWRNTNGSIALWTMDGATVKSSSLTSTPSLDHSWTTAGTGDYNGDGKADILWRNTNGGIVVWTMDGATMTSSSKTSTPSLDPSWKVAGNSDFNGDGKSDILWRNDDGSVALWQMNGAAITASTAVAKVSTDWKIAGTGDFNGDGKADILWRNDNGTISLWQMDGATLVAGNKTSTSSLDSSWNVAGIGDYNGDGKSDILWRNAGGTAVVWTMDGANVVSSALTSVAADGNGWKVAAPII